MIRVDDKMHSVLKKSSTIVGVEGKFLSHSQMTSIIIGKHEMKSEYPTSGKFDKSVLTK